MLGDHPKVGYAPDRYNFRGERQPRYAWIWTENLKYPAKDGSELHQRPSGIYCYEPTWHMVPQYPELAWALAKWTEPGPPDEWERKYNGELRYPDHGQYIVTDIVLPLGEEPNEAWTMAAIGAITEQQVRNLHDFIALSEGKIAAADKKSEQLVSDLIDSECMQFDSVPGKRGSSAVSWGGVEFETKETV